MALKEFSVGHLAELDEGRLATALQQELRRAVQDCKDRPGEKKPRKICLTFEVEPEDVEPGTADCESVQISAAIKQAFPARRTRGYSMRVQHSGALLFNPMAPDNHRQKTIDDGEASE